MATTESEKNIQKIIKKAVDDMNVLGVYRSQFDSAIRVYAEMKDLLNTLTKEFYDGGCAVTEDYTNKAGATNKRKTALYCTIEQLRRDVAAAEDRLGLSPAGMKRINEAEMKSRKKISKLDSALEKIGH